MHPIFQRTFPISGRYSREQRALYEVVLAAQLAAIDEVLPGRPFSAAHEAAVRVIAEGLCALGLLKGDADSAIAEGSYKRFFPAKTGHWLGLDVHDVGDYRVDGEPRLLEPGMVVTVEPGIYVSPGDANVAERWRGIGIRIEDDVAVTRDGNEVLTAAYRKTPKRSKPCSHHAEQGRHGSQRRVSRWGTSPRRCASSVASTSYHMALSIANAQARPRPSIQEKYHMASFPYQ